MGLANPHANSSLPSIHQPINPSTHQSINPSTHQSINPSTHQPINPSIHQPINPSIHQSINPSTHQFHQHINPSIHQSSFPSLPSLPFPSLPLHYLHLPMSSTAISWTPLDLQMSTNSVNSEGATFHSRIRSLMETTLESLAVVPKLSPLPSS